MVDSIRHPTAGSYFLARLGKSREDYAHVFSRVIWEEGGSNY